MFKVKILTIGKLKEKWLSSALREYEKRLSHKISIEWILCKNDSMLEKAIQKEKSYACLDIEGKMLTSEQFSNFVFSTFEKTGMQINFVIGGAEGVKKEILENATTCISFSKMTFTHQMMRLILVEQIYRSLEIKKNSSYHK